MPLAVNCPECGTELEVDDEYRAWKVRCPACRHEFVPAAGGVCDEPAPRRRRRRDYDDYDDPRAAAMDVSGPATGLRVVGWINVAMSLMAFGIAALLVVVALNAPQGRQNGGPQREEAIGQAVFYAFEGVIGLGFSFVILTGAGKMARLESSGWALTAAVVSMIPYASCCCLLGLPFGIWAIVVLNRPDVQAAFRRNDRRRHTRYDDDDE